MVTVIAPHPDYVGRNFFLSVLLAQSLCPYTLCLEIFLDLREDGVKVLTRDR